MLGVSFPGKYKERNVPPGCVTKAEERERDTKSEFNLETFGGGWWSSEGAGRGSLAEYSHGCSRRVTPRKFGEQGLVYGDSSRVELAWSHRA